MPIIVVTGKEIEKIKGDYESYLSGLNMVGKIDYSQYSQLYDEGTKHIQRAYELGKSELEKENTELKKNYEDSLVTCGLLKEKIDLMTKPSPIEVMQDALITTQKVAFEKQKDQLTKAKEHIENLLYYIKQCTCERSNYAEIEKDIKEAEQFLKEE